MRFSPTRLWRNPFGLLRRSRRCLRWALCFCAWAVLHAQPAHAAQDSSADSFLVTLVEGPAFTAPLLEIRDDGRTFVFAVDGARRSVPVEQLVQLRRALPDAAVQSASSSFFLLTGGNRLGGKLVKATEDALTVESSLFGSIEIPLEVVRAIVLLVPNDPAARHQMVQRLTAHDEPNDLVLLENGDTFLGTFLQMDDAHLMLETSAGELSIARDTVAAIAMNPQLVARPVLDGLRGVVQLQQGSRLTVRLPEFHDGRFELQTAFGTALTIDAAQLLSLQVLGGKVQYLSDLEPAGYHHTPFLGLSWPWMRDRSVGGRTLRMGGRPFAKGLGVHSRSELTYDLAGEYRRFDATIGIDDETQRAGSVIFRVLVDGQERWASPVVRGADPPRELDPIDLIGAKQLTLVVEFADRGDVQDHADWGDARIIR
jgi:hypothetical protein